MVRIILVRHGETNWNKEGRYQGQIDTDLSERGLEQGKALAQALKDIKIDICYASPLSRALETAKMCLEYHAEVLLVTDDRLLEINHGLWEGKLSDDVKVDYAAMLEAWRVNPASVTMPEGESITDVCNRSMAAFEDYAKHHDGNTILVAAHDAVNKAVVCKMLDIGLDHFWQIKQDNTCINVIEYHEGSWRMVLLNSTSHLGFLFSGIEQKGL